MNDSTKNLTINTTGLKEVDKYLGQISTVIHKYESRLFNPQIAQRLVLNYTYLVNSNPALINASQTSLFLAILKATTTGLDFMDGDIYAIPFNTKNSPNPLVSVIISPNGYIKKLYKTGLIKESGNYVIYKDDMFKVKPIHKEVIFEQADENIGRVDYDKNVPNLKSSDVRGYLSYVILNNGSVDYEFRTLKSVMNHETEYSKQYQNAVSKGWNLSKTTFNQMGIKVVQKALLRRLVKQYSELDDAGISEMLKLDQSAITPAEEIIYPDNPQNDAVVVEEVNYYEMLADEEKQEIENAGNYDEKTKNEVAKQIYLRRTNTSQ
jgi:phage RecT family recombinase